MLLEAVTAFALSASQCFWYGVPRLKLSLALGCRTCFSLYPGLTLLALGQIKQTPRPKLYFASGVPAEILTDMLRCM